MLHVKESKSRIWEGRWIVCCDYSHALCKGLEIQDMGRKMDSML